MQTKHNNGEYRKLKKKNSKEEMLAGSLSTEDFLKEENKELRKKLAQKLYRQDVMIIFQK